MIPVPATDPVGRMHLTIAPVNRLTAAPDSRPTKSAGMCVNTA